MTTKQMVAEAEDKVADMLQNDLGDDALQTGLTIILADAARSHLQAGNLDKATRCLQAAQRCLGLLRSA